MGKCPDCQCGEGDYTCCCPDCHAARVAAIKAKEGLPVGGTSCPDDGPDTPRAGQPSRRHDGFEGTRGGRRIVRKSEPMAG